ncbi:MAG: NADH-quinone oxidoreductase subunit M [Ktedonobacteraceae bacterium]|nr:NADH-quinone oxidoreductase subunit M [Ktedonobacteraceae bacterium]
MLSLITFLPIVGAIVLLFFPKDQLNVIRWTALGIAIASLVVSIIAVLIYSQVSLSAPFTGSTFYLVQNVTWISSLGINYSLAIDGISALLVLLTALLTVVCIGASFRIDRKVKNYMAFMLLLEGGLIGVFLASNLFLFYIFWEVMLIPAYFLVGAWGGEHRIYAAFKFVLYTSVGSFLMLAAIIALGYFHQQASGGGYTLDLITLLNGKLDNGIQVWLLLGFAAAFAVKVPLVPFHSWLPDAYTEAPAPVTAMLAGAMAKAGAYGFLRFCIPLFPNAIQTLAPLFRILAVIGILYCAWQALTQTDLKRILAYSSISHLGVIILAMFAFNTQGVEGSVLQMVNHGITIAALFLLVGFLEERTGTRRIGDFGGLATRIPVLATVMLIASLSSLGLPGLNSFAGEFPALLGTFRNNVTFGVLGTIVVVPAAWYMIRFFQNVMEGPRKTDGNVGVLLRKGTLVDIRVDEFVALLPLLVLIFFIGLYPAPLTALMEPSVTNIMQNLGSLFIK